MEHAVLTGNNAHTDGCWVFQPHTTSKKDVISNTLFERRKCGMLLDFAEYMCISSSLRGTFPGYIC